MTEIYARLRGKRSECKIITTTQLTIYPSFDENIISLFEYMPDSTLKENEWFRIKDASKEDYAIDLMKDRFSSVDKDQLVLDDVKDINYLFSCCDDIIYFQKMTKAKLVAKKRISLLNEKYEYFESACEIVINDLPDAIYSRSNDELYFQKLERITTIFEKIDQLYRAATSEETEAFLNSDFIQLKDGFSSKNVKTANRKRIALAMKTLSNLEDQEKNNILKYIVEYCPDLKMSDNAIGIGSESELKMLLYGIDQRFYTTPIGGEKRIANSVLLFDNTSRH